MAVHEPDLPYLPPSTAEYQGAPVLLGKSCEIQARVVSEGSGEIRALSAEYTKVLQTADTYSLLQESQAEL